MSSSTGRPSLSKKPDVLRPPVLQASVPFSLDPCETLVDLPERTHFNTDCPDHADGFSATIEHDSKVAHPRQGLVLVLVGGEEARGGAFRPVTDESAQGIGHLGIVAEPPRGVGAIDPGRRDKRAPELLQAVLLLIIRSLVTSSKKSMLCRTCTDISRLPFGSGHPRAVLPIGPSDLIAAFPCDEGGAGGRARAARGDETEVALTREPASFRRSAGVPRAGRLARRAPRAVRDGWSTSGPGDSFRASQTV